MKRLTPARLITVICSVFLVGLGSPAAGAVDLMPEASPGFVPKISYPQDVGTVTQAITNTLNTLSIPIVSSSQAQIVTDYVEGPTTQAQGRITHSRYRFMIAVRPAQDRRGLGLRARHSLVARPRPVPERRVRRLVQGPQSTRTP